MVVRTLIDSSKAVRKHAHAPSRGAASAGRHMITGERDCEIGVKYGGGRAGCSLILTASISYQYAALSTTEW